MRDVNELDKVSAEDLIEHRVLSVKFVEYLRKTLKYTKAEAEFVAATDFTDAYDCMFVVHDYEGIFEVAGKEYNVYSCRTDFRMCGLFHLDKYPPFEFYMFIDPNDLPDMTVGSYSKAKKLYYI